MAVADRTQQILAGGQGSAPFSYVVPASTVFSLLGVFASFDGTAAAGSFLPCVQIVSDAGVVMAETVGSSVAAGGSADVTFAPFLETQTAAIGGISSPQVETFVSEAPSVGAGTLFTYPFTHLSGQTLVTGAGSGGPQPAVDGVYCLVVTADAVSSTAFTAGRGFHISPVVSDGTGGSMIPNQGIYVGSFLNGARISSSAAMWMPSATGSFQALLRNTDSIAHTLNMQAVISRLA